MSIEAMKQALDALELVLETDTKPKHEISKSITSLRQAIEKAEKREPKKWVEVECPLCGEMAVAHTHPNLNKREWVGLTDEEITALKRNGERYISSQEFARAIEVKLKEKNT